MEDMEKKAPETAEKEVEKKNEKKKSDKPAFSERLKAFFRSYKSEIKKIVWCPWKQVRKNTYVVLVVIVVVAAGICLLDYGFSKGILGLGSLI